MRDILFLHGFGETRPQSCPVARSVKSAVFGIHVLCPPYHPAGAIAATRISTTLKALIALITNDSPSRKVDLVGYSFGGLLAALLAEQRPDLIANVLLLAPAIDNFARNYEQRPSSSWHMPTDYVEELRTYPARPAIVCPTVLVHGLLDDDSQDVPTLPQLLRQFAAN